jgi:integrase
MVEKAKKGTIQIKSSNNRLQLVFSHGGKRRYVSLGLPETNRNLGLARMKANEIESDIFKGCFDESLKRYKFFTSSEPQPINLAEGVGLKELWSKYVVFKRSQVSPSTIVKDFAKVENHLKRLSSDSLEDAIMIRDFYVKHLSPNAAKRVLTQINACCNWAMKSGLIKVNPFQGMAAEIRLPKGQGRSEEDDIDPFSLEERDRIITAFENNRNYCQYTSFIEFLFRTGCRPSEAIALQWSKISSDFKTITFDQAVIVSENGLVLKKGLKTQLRREFPCNQGMQQFLKRIQPEAISSDRFIFPSPEDKFIDFHNFANRAWKRILSTLNMRYRKPYQTRHTFITLCLEAGMDAKDVAKLVGNSPEMIYRHYAAARRELAVPEF